MWRSTAVPALFAAFVAVSFAACDRVGALDVSPVIEVTSHEDGQTLAEADVVVSGELSGGPVTSFSATLGGVAVEAATYTDAAFSVPATLAVGENTLLLEAASGEATAQATLVLNYAPEVVPEPEPGGLLIDVTSHEDGQAVSEADVVVSGELSGGPVTSFSATLDGVAVDGATHTDTAFSVPLRLAVGENALVLDATSEDDTAQETLLLTYAPEPVAIAVTSHGEGQRIFGAREVEVSGTLSGGTPTGFSARLNGVEIADATFAAGSFTVPVTLGDASNEVELEAVSDAGTSSESLTLVYPFLPLEDFAPAVGVLGQPDFESGGSATTASSLNGPYGAPVRTGEGLYLADYSNDRVLGFFDWLVGGVGLSADFALGQSDLESSVGSNAADGLDSPVATAIGDGTLFVSEWSNSRVLGWNPPPTTMKEPADFVLGQPGFDSGGSACSQAGMDGVEGVFATDEVLLVADEGNHRVLIYSPLPTATGDLPDLVLGQDAFDECAPNDIDQDGAGDATVGPSTLRRPTDAWTDGTRLIVADAGNHRVLIWNTFPTEHGQAADIAVGQDSLVASGAGSGPSSLNSPWFVDSNGNQLFVADRENNRVLIFDEMPSDHGASADRVLGQSDFTHTTENDDDQNAVKGDTPTARTLWDPRGVRALDEALVLVDGNNHRVLVYVPQAR